MGKEWGASPDLIGTANGLLSGVAAILGSLFGGVLSAKLDKRWAYALCGVALSCVAFAWAVSPQEPEVYVAGVLLYNFALGMCYAAFTAFVLDIIGHTGGATKYNLFASLANVPIILMTTADGSVSDHFGRIA